MSTTGFNNWEINSEVQHHGSTLEFNIVEVNSWVQDWIGQLLGSILERSTLGFNIGLVKSWV